MVGSVKRESATGKRRILRGVLFARDGIEKHKTTQGSDRGDRLEQVACQVADLALEMTEHSCPWPREGLFSERLSLASDFFCVLGLGLEPCVLDSTSAKDLKIDADIHSFFVT